MICLDKDAVETWCLYFREIYKGYYERWKWCDTNVVA